MPNPSLTVPGPICMELDISASHKWTWEEITGGAYAQDTPQVPVISVETDWI